MRPEGAAGTALPPAIVLAGDVMGLALVRSLGVKSVPVSVAYRHGASVAATSRYVRERIEVPSPEVDEAGVVARLAEIGPRYRGAVLIPGSDEMLIVASRHRAELEEWYRVACAEWPVARRFVDKQFTYALADEAGVPAPRTVVLRSADDVERQGTQVSYPVLIKPSQSHLYSEVFGRKMTEVHDLDGLRAAFAEAHEAGLEVLLQELIPGDDTQGTSYNCYMWDGVARVEFTAWKLRLLPKRFGRPTAMVSGHIPELLDLGSRLLRAAGYNGYANIEFKRDARDGVHKLMEVNARMNLASLMAMRAGINFPWLMYRHMAFGELPEARDFADGVHWIDGGRDIATCLTAIARRQMSVRSFLRPYARRHVYAVLDARDPMPAVSRYGAYAMAAPRKLISRVIGSRSEAVSEGEGGRG
jgi:D-aspartate ligase